MGGGILGGEPNWTTREGGGRAKLDDPLRGRAKLDDPLREGRKISDLVNIF